MNNSYFILLLGDNMNELAEKLNVEEMIYEIRGEYVMLDSDLARLYECKNGTKEVNQAVRNNPKKFPDRFSWKLSDEETEKLRSKFLTANISKMSRKNPRVFTEQGVAMLATVLKTKVAIETSIRIMDAFVAMKKYISNGLLEQRYINNIVLEDHDKIKNLEISFQKFEEKKKVNDIYFAGQMYDAYSKILEIFISAKKELIIVDSYADKTLLDIVRRLKINVIIVTKENNLLKEIDINKYNEQYSNLKLIYNETFHDRYFIIDNKIIYHCGTSINRIGHKTFCINLISDEDVYKSLLEKIGKILE